MAVTQGTIQTYDGELLRAAITVGTASGPESQFWLDARQTPPNVGSFVGDITNEDTDPATRFTRWRWNNSGNGVLLINRSGGIFMSLQFVAGGSMDGKHLYISTSDADAIPDVDIDLLANLSGNPGGGFVNIAPTAAQAAILSAIRADDVINIVIADATVASATTHDTDAALAGGSPSVTASAQSVGASTHDTAATVAAGAPGVSAGAVSVAAGMHDAAANLTAGAPSMAAAAEKVLVDLASKARQLRLVGGRVMTVDAQKRPLMLFHWEVDRKRTLGTLPASGEASLIAHLRLNWPGGESAAPRMHIFAGWSPAPIYENAIHEPIIRLETSLAEQLGLGQASGRFTERYQCLLRTTPDGTGLEDTEWRIGTTPDLAKASDIANVIMSLIIRTEVMRASTNQNDITFPTVLPTTLNV